MHDPAVVRGIYHTTAKSIEQVVDGRRVALADRAETHGGIQLAHEEIPRCAIDTSRLVGERNTQHVPARECAGSTDTSTSRRCGYRAAASSAAAAAHVVLPTPPLPQNNTNRAHLASNAPVRRGCLHGSSAAVIARFIDRFGARTLTMHSRRVAQLRSNAAERRHADGFIPPGPDDRHTRRES